MQDLINRIIELKNRLQKAWQAIQIDEKRTEVIRLHEKMNEPNFWQDQLNAKKVTTQANYLESEINDWESLKKEIIDLLEITQLDKDDQTVNLRQEVERQLEKLEKRFEQLEMNLMFSDKYDKGDCLVAIHAGAGGTDAQDWAEMILRMFFRFAEKENFKTNIINISSGSEAGIKSVLFEVIGHKAYGYFKSESGVHRLVRISPFDAEKMRHTSFALVEVLPYFDEEIEIEIKEDDLRIDTYRSGGNGGQGVNTTDSAVRITHLPTNIIVTCQNERSQVQNKQTALKILKVKLQKYYETEIEEERQKIRGEYTEAAWGNQIRSYVLHPYKMVKDHRTNFETVEVENVLDGDLIGFIEAYLRNNIQAKEGKK